MSHGYCIIPCDNLKQYQKVLKRLKKDKIVFEESLLDDAKWGLLTRVDGKATRSIYPYDEFVPEFVSGPAFLFTW